MVRVVRIDPGLDDGLPNVLVDELSRSGTVYQTGLDAAAIRRLGELGIEALEVPTSGVPDGSVLLVPDDAASAGAELSRLVRIVDRLLGPGGCPWDREQTHASLKRHLLEETYELLEAIDSGDRERLLEELGDLLLQPVMHAQMEREAGSFDVGEVARKVSDKLVRRHPHVFGPLKVEDADEVLRNWDRIKKEEKSEPDASILGGVPKAMPSLLRAFEISKRAARVGFEWPDLDAVFGKLREEESELREAAEAGLPERIEAEIGDLLFTAVNLARWLGVEPEEALRGMLDRFVARFRHMERSAGAPLRELSPDQWDALWEDAKAQS